MRECFDGFQGRDGPEGTMFRPLRAQIGATPVARCESPGTSTMSCSPPTMPHSWRLRLSCRKHDFQKSRWSSTGTCSCSAKPILSCWTVMEGSTWTSACGTPWRSTRNSKGPDSQKPIETGSVLAAAGTEAVVASGLWATGPEEAKALSSTERSSWALSRRRGFASAAGFVGLAPIGGRLSGGPRTPLGRRSPGWKGPRLLPSIAIAAADLRPILRLYCAGS
mmetsp:Transcript_23039/g.48262  ORF Transcript_23039/g.48262 Transcript_23039/m.48262 type:complete len:222 (-) Transcript_23039:6-671(-)